MYNTKHTRSSAVARIGTTREKERKRGNIGLRYQATSCEFITGAEKGNLPPLISCERSLKKIVAFRPITRHVLRNLCSASGADLIFFLLGVLYLIHSRVAWGISVVDD